MKYYLSGAVSGDSDFRKKFNEAEKFLVEHNHKVVNPVKGEVDGKEWSYYLKKDIKKLLGCDAIILLNDWEKSKGARLEKHIAEELGYEVYEFDVLKEYSE